MRAALVALLVAGLAAGCANRVTGEKVVAEGQSDLAAAVVCCKTLADAQRQPLPTGKDAVTLVIDRTRQAFDFGGNKAFFVLLELPPFQQTYSIALASESRGSLQDSALFIPRVAMYDADFKPTRFFDEKTLRNRGSELERTVFVNPKDAAERYMVIFGSDLSASIERTYALVTVTPMFAGPVMFNVVSGSDTKGVMRSAPVGSVRLEVSGLPAR